MRHADSQRRFLNRVMLAAAVLLILICALDHTRAQVAAVAPSAQPGVAGVLALHVVDQSNQQALSGASIIVQAWNDADLTRWDDSQPKRTFTADAAGNCED